MNNLTKIKEASHQLEKINNKNKEYYKRVYNDFLKRVESNDIENIQSMNSDEMKDALIIYYQQIEINKELEKVTNLKFKPGSWDNTTNPKEIEEKIKKMPPALVKKVFLDSLQPKKQIKKKRLLGLFNR